MRTAVARFLFDFISFFFFLSYILLLFLFDSNSFKAILLRVSMLSIEQSIHSILDVWMCVVEDFQFKWEQMRQFSTVSLLYRIDKEWARPTQPYIQPWYINACVLCMQASYLYKLNKIWVILFALSYMNEFSDTQILVKWIAVTCERAIRARMIWATVAHTLEYTRSNTMYV